MPQIDLDYNTPPPVPKDERYWPCVGRFALTILCYWTPPLTLHLLTVPLFIRLWKGRESHLSEFAQVTMPALALLQSGWGFRLLGLLVIAPFFLAATMGCIPNLPTRRMFSRAAIACIRWLAIFWFVWLCITVLPNIPL